MRLGCFLSILVVLLLGWRGASAALKIDITRGNAEKTVISLAPVSYGTNLEDEAGTKLLKIIKSNLTRSGIFSVVSNKIQNFAVDVRAMPTSDTWKNIKTETLLTTSVQELSGSKLEVRFRLWDIPSARQLVGKSLIFETNDLRRVGHIISDVIYSRVTGDEGYFDTKIVYIAESGQAPRSRRVAIMDQDGANTTYLTDGSRFVLTPRFSPNTQKIVYMSYIDRKARIILKDLESAKEVILGDFDGVISAPRFSPDGKSVLLSESKSGRTDIYNVDLKSYKLSKLTRGTSINTSASYAPDKSAIVFNSDRTGSQQLYVMEADGSKQRRISFGEGRYASPVWSPRGDWIAFTKMKSGKFYIGIMKPNGTGERLLTEGYMVEGPTWSSNGRVITFTRQERSTENYKAGWSKISSIDITGANERVIPTPTDASSPNWSYPRR